MLDEDGNGIKERNIVEDMLGRKVKAKFAKKMALCVSLGGCRRLRDEVNRKKRQFGFSRLLY